ncbi:hypothetical protein [Rufibacter roseus]|uniref:XRE family transcriptional regulator n=1 Tax=Rufibacter roseus TaxID=1567108 RepID=A0ABW2DK61_9BACT|nr:hypothetical protein [Rufibacter roseus]
METKETNTRPVRELMPDGYLNLVAQESGMSNPNISNVVNNEKRTSFIWPIVERLAKETDAKAYEKRMKFLAKRDKAQKALKEATRTQHQNAA